MTRDETIDDVTRRLVEYFQVVVPDDIPEDKLRPGAARSAVRGTDLPRDIIPWRKTDFEQRALWVKASLPATVVREGRVLYDAT